MIPKGGVNFCKLKIDQDVHETGGPGKLTAPLSAFRNVVSATFRFPPQCDVSMGVTFRPNYDVSMLPAGGEGWESRE
jgi:hypothetical protein